MHLNCQEIPDESQMGMCTDQDEWEYGLLSAGGTEI